MQTYSANSPPIPYFPQIRHPMETNKPPIEVFLSCGTPDDEEQEHFIAAMEAQLKSHNFVPLTVGRSKFSGRQAVESARDVIESCHGAVVIAFERTRVLQGLERPNSPQKKVLNDERYPTVWNQMEAAMAYSYRLPILTIVEPGLKRQGMLGERVEWVPIEASLKPELFVSEEFRQVFANWAQHVHAHASLRATPTPKPVTESQDPAELKIGQLLSQLRLKQTIIIMVAVGGFLTTIATTSFSLGKAWAEAEKKPTTTHPTTSPAVKIP